MVEEVSAFSEKIVFYFLEFWVSLVTRLKYHSQNIVLILPHFGQWHVWNLSHRPDFLLSATALVLATMRLFFLCSWVTSSQEMFREESLLMLVGQYVYSFVGHLYLPMSGFPPHS